MGGVGDASIRLLYTGGGDGEVSSLYNVPLSVIPVGIGGDIDPSWYTAGGVYTGLRSGGGEGVLSSR